MNVLSLKTALKRYAGLSDDDPLLEWLNAAMHEFEDAYEWSWLEVRTTSIATAVGANTITVPSDFGRVKVIKDSVAGGKDPLEYMPQVQFFSEFTDLTATGDPMYYTTTGSDLLWWPVANAAVTWDLTYQKALEDLVNDTDEPAIPVKWHYGLVYGATAYGLQAESEEDRAANAENKFEKFISRAIARDSRRQVGEPEYTREVMDYDAP